MNTWWKAASLPSLSSSLCTSLPSPSGNLPYFAPKEGRHHNKMRRNSGLQEQVPVTCFSAISTAWSWASWSESLNVKRAFEVCWSFLQCTMNQDENDSERVKLFSRLFKNELFSYLVEFAGSSQSLDKLCLLRLILYFTLKYFSSLICHGWTSAFRL